MDKSVNVRELTHLSKSAFEHSQVGQVAVVVTEVDVVVAVDVRLAGADVGVVTEVVIVGQVTAGGHVGCFPHPMTGQGPEFCTGQSRRIRAVISSTVGRILSWPEQPSVATHF